MFSRSVTGIIGHDCVPVTASETTAEGMSAGFANYLAAAAHVDRIATTCRAAQQEYAGWRAMLAGAGQSGPDIRCVPLPVQANVPSDTARAEARDLLAIGSLPLVLSVGSHEPRKNHLAVLHAAEVLWREGQRFSLAFLGGNSWNSAEFEAQVQALQAANRPLQTLRGLPDELLWAAYRLAYCTVFASLHEGFGLPVAESLASGTPVITSNFGSMKELASHGGALLVDPRDDRSLIHALRQLLTDRPLRDRLAAQAASLPLRSWDQYATETWAYLVKGESPDRAAVDEAARHQDHLIDNPADSQ
jgi:glycosyltransferase involved in cell wall biosynthesis